jgi:hypothetical protein
MERKDKTAKRKVTKGRKKVPIQNERMKRRGDRKGQKRGGKRNERKVEKGRKQDNPTICIFLPIYGTGT